MRLSLHASVISRRRLASRLSCKIFRKKLPHLAIAHYYSLPAVVARLWQLGTGLPFVWQRNRHHGYYFFILPALRLQKASAITFLGRRKRRLPWLTGPRHTTWKRCLIILRIV